MIEHRALRSTEIRVTPDTRTFEAVVVRYGVVDDYDTIFDAGCFAASLEERMPRITWAHDWAEPLGRYVDYKDTPEQLTLIGEFDDFDAVPRARQAWTQLSSGTIDQFSVGFHRIAIREDDDHRTHFTEAGLDEAALVLVGAVPGTALLSVRSVRTQGGLVVPEDVWMSLAEKVAKGEITQEAAQAAMSLAAGAPLGGDGGDGSASAVDAEPPADHSEADAVLEEMGL